MNQTILKYPWITVLVFVIWGLLTAAESLDEEKYWPIIIYGLAFSILVFIAGFLMCITRLFNERYKYRAIHYGIGFYNFIGAVSNILMFAGQLSLNTAMFLYPLCVGLFLIVDVYGLNKRNA